MVTESGSATFNPNDISLRPHGPKLSGLISHNTTPEVPPEEATPLPQDSHDEYVPSGAPALATAAPSGSPAPLPNLRAQALEMLQQMREAIENNNDLSPKKMKKLLKIIDQAIEQLEALEGTAEEISAQSQEIVDEVNQKIREMSPQVQQARKRIKQLNKMLEQGNLPPEFRAKLEAIRDQLRYYVADLLKGNIEAAQAHLTNAQGLQNELEQLAEQDSFCNALLLLDDRKKVLKQFKGTEYFEVLSDLFDRLQEAVDAMDHEAVGLLMGEIDEQVKAAAQARILSAGSALLSRQDELIDLVAQNGGTQADIDALLQLFSELEEPLAYGDYEQVQAKMHAIELALQPFFDHARAAALLNPIESLIAAIQILMAQRDASGLGNPVVADMVAGTTVTSSVDANGNPVVTISPDYSVGLTGVPVLDYVLGQDPEIDPQSLEDLLLLLERVKASLEQGVIPSEIDDPQSFEAFCQQILTSAPVAKAVELVQKVKKAYQTVMMLTSIAASGSIAGAAALGVRALLGGFAVSNVGKMGVWLAAMTAEAATFSLVQRGISCVLFGQSFYQDFGDFATDFWVNFAMFGVLKGGSALYAKTIKLIDPQFAKSFPKWYQLGEFGAEYAVFNLWSIVEQIGAFYLGVAPEDVTLEQILSIDNCEEILLNNAKMLIGLKIAGFILRPLSSALLTGIPQAQRAALTKNADRMADLVADLQKGKITIEQFRGRQIELLEGRLAILRGLQATGLEVAGEITALEKALGELRGIEENVQGLLAGQTAAGEAAPTEVTVVQGADQTPTSDLAYAETILVHEADTAVIEAEGSIADQAHSKMVDAYNKFIADPNPYNFINYVQAFFMCNGSYPTLEAASEAWAQVEARRIELTQLRESNPAYEGLPLYRIDALEQAQVAWEAQTNAEARAELETLCAELGIASTPEAIMEHMAELWGRIPDNALLTEFRILDVLCKGMEFNAGTVAGSDVGILETYHHIEPEWVQELTLAEYSFTQGLPDIIGVKGSAAGAKAASLPGYCVVMQEGKFLLFDSTKGEIIEGVLVERSLDGRLFKFRIELQNGEEVLVDAGMIGEGGRLALMGGYETYDQLVEKYVAIYGEEAGKEIAQKVIQLRQEFVEHQIVIDSSISAFEAVLSTPEYASLVDLMHEKGISQLIVAEGIQIDANKLANLRILIEGLTEGRRALFITNSGIYTFSLAEGESIQAVDGPSGRIYRLVQENGQPAGQVLLEFTMGDHGFEVVSTIGTTISERFTLATGEGREVIAGDGSVLNMGHFGDSYIIYRKVTVEHGAVMMYSIQPGETKYVFGLLVEVTLEGEVIIRQVPRRPEYISANNLGESQPASAAPAEEVPVQADPVDIGINDNVNAQNYGELGNIEVLQNGDILPGHDFVLGDPETYGRELLTVNTGPDSPIRPVLDQAKSMGDAMKQSGYSDLEIAEAIAKMVNEEFAKTQGHSIVQNGALMTVGAFMEGGGCCRHRAALLQLALQEAGIKSHYVRGVAGIGDGGGMHAWVEVDAKGDGSYSYVIDPNLHVSGWIKSVKNKNGQKTYKLGMITYSVNPDQLNVVWRPNNAESLQASSDQGAWLEDGYQVHDDLAEIEIPTGNALYFRFNIEGAETWEIVRLNDGRYFLRDQQGELREITKDNPVLFKDSNSQTVLILAINDGKLNIQDSSTEGMLYDKNFHPLAAEVLESVAPE